MENMLHNFFVLFGKLTKNLLYEVQFKFFSGDVRIGMLGGVSEATITANSLQNGHKPSFGTL